MNEAMAVAAWSGGCTCSELQARVSLRISPIQGVETPETGTSSPVQPQQFRTRALWPPFPSFTMPCVMGDNDSPSSVILCVLFGTLDPLLGSLWPCADRPPTFDRSEQVHFYHLSRPVIIFLPLPPQLVLFY